MAGDQSWANPGPWGRKLWPFSAKARKSSPALESYQPQVYTILSQLKKGQWLETSYQEWRLRVATGGETLFSNFLTVSHHPHFTLLPRVIEISDTESGDVDISVSLGHHGDFPVLGSMRSIPYNHQLWKTIIIIIKHTHTNHPNCKHRQGTVIAEIFVRVKISYSSIRELSYAINFRTARTVSNTTLYVHGFRMLPNFVLSAENTKFKSRTKIDHKINYRFLVLKKSKTQKVHIEHIEHFDPYTMQKNTQQETSMLTHIGKLTMQKNACL